MVKDSDHLLFPLLCRILGTGNVIVWKFLAQERAMLGSMWGYQHVGSCTQHSDVARALDYLYMNVA